MKDSSSCRTCELIENCSFYWSYNQHPAVLERQLIVRFCLSEDEPVSCARIQYLRNEQESPPPFLTPEGDCIDTLVLKTSDRILTV